MNSNYFLSAANNGLTATDAPLMGLIFDVPTTTARLATAYGAAGLEAPLLAPADLVAIGDDAVTATERIATDLVAAAVHADADARRDLIEDAMNETLKAQAWKDLRPSLDRATQTVARDRWNEVRPAIVSDLAPATGKTLAALEKAVAKLDGVNPLDFDAVVTAKGDVLAVHETINAISVLGALSAAYPLGRTGRSRFRPEQLAEILHLVKLETPGTELLIDYDGMGNETLAQGVDDVVRSVWEINRAMNETRSFGPDLDLIGFDDVLIRIAAGAYPGITLEAAADQTEVARRAVALDRATAPVRVGRRRPADPFTVA